MWNVHIMFITHIDNIEHRNPETQKHLRLLSSGTKLFYYLWIKRLFDIKRETQFSIQASPSAPNHVHTRHKATGLASASKRKSTFFLRARNSTQLTDFFKIPQILRARFRCMMPFTSPGPGIFILTSVNDTSPPARQHLRSNLHLTNPCTESKGSQPN